MAAKDDGDVQRVGDGEQAGFFILNGRSTEACELPDDAGDQLRVLLPQFAVDLNEAVIDLRIVADQPVGGHQAAEPVAERGAGGKALRFVDEDAGQLSIHSQQFS